MSNINNHLFEAMLRQAVIQNSKNQMAALPSEEELAKIYTFSDEHNRKMKKLFAADKRRETVVVIFKWSKVVAIAVCVSVTLMFGTLLTSAEFREAVGNVIITWFDKFTKFQSQDSQFTEREWLLEYLPEGFSLHDSYRVGDIKGVEYNNSNGVTIEFSYSPSDFSTSVDNEDREYEILLENNIYYHVFETTINDNKSNIIIWDMEEYRFTVMGNCDIEELLKIAFSVN